MNEGTRETGTHIENLETDNANVSEEEKFKLLANALQKAASAVDAALEKGEVEQLMHNGWHPGTRALVKANGLMHAIWLKR